MVWRVRFTELPALDRAGAGGPGGGGGPRGDGPAPVPGSPCLSRPPRPSCNSEVKYASERHFRDNVFYAPVPTVTAYSETIVAAPNCTWRNYRSQLTLEPRPRALHFRSTTIIFPKRARSTFRTTLHCSLGRPSRRFTSSVQLQLLLGPAAL